MLRTILVALLLLGSAPAFSVTGLPTAEDTTPKPLVLAHRGGAAEAPENTLVAFRHAIAAGADWFELDVQASADGVPVVIHDATLDRTTDCTGPVADYTMAELRSCNACADFCTEHPFVPLSSLDEVLDALADESIRIMIEIKNDPTEPETFDPLDLVLLPAVAQSLNRHPDYLDAGRIMVSSFNFKTTTLMHHLVPGLPVGFLTLNPVDAHAELAYAYATGHHALQAKIDGVADWNGAQLAEDARRLGLQLHVWTVDDSDAWSRLARQNVDGIITDRPSELVTLLAN